MTNETVVFGVGSEHGSAWGLDHLTVAPDGRCVYENRHSGDVRVRVEGVLDRETLAAVHEALKVANFPFVPEHSRPPGAGTLTISAPSSSESAFIHLHEGKGFTGYGALIALLDVWMPFLRAGPIKDESSAGLQVIHSSGERAKTDTELARSVRAYQLAKKAWDRSEAGPQTPEFITVKETAQTLKAELRIARGVVSALPSDSENRERLAELMALIDQLNAEDLRVGFAVRDSTEVPPLATDRCWVTELDMDRRNGRTGEHVARAVLTRDGRVVFLGLVDNGHLYIIDAALDPIGPEKLAPSAGYAYLAALKDHWSGYRRFVGPFSMREEDALAGAPRPPEAIAEVT